MHKPHPPPKGAGKKAFAAGADIKEMAELPADEINELFSKKLVGQRATIQSPKPMQFLEATQEIGDGDGMLTTCVRHMIQALKASSCLASLCGKDLDPLVR